MEFLFADMIEFDRVIVLTDKLLDLKSVEVGLLEGNVKNLDKVIEYNNTIITLLDQKNAEVRECIEIITGDIKAMTEHIAVRKEQDAETKALKEIEKIDEQIKKLSSYISKMENRSRSSSPTSPKKQKTVRSDAGHSEPTTSSAAVPSPKNTPKDKEANAINTGQNDSE